MIETVNIGGAPISIHYLFWFLGLIVAFIVGSLIRKWYGFSLSKAFLYISYDVGIGFLLLFVTSWISGGGRMNGINFVRMIYLAGLYFWLLAKLFKDPYGDVSDFLTIKGAFFFGIVKFGCIFPGCCQGYPFAWGIYSNASNAICFPIQIIESLTLLLIGLLLLWMVKRNIGQGKLYAWFLVIFGSTRFVFEFFRDNTKIWLNISELAIHAFIAVIVGAIVLFITKKKDQRDLAYEKNQM